jgi:hypothetical protein
MVVLAFLTDPDVIHKILKHLELRIISPPLLPVPELFDRPIRIQRQPFRATFLPTGAPGSAVAAVLEAWDAWLAEYHL